MIKWQPFINKYLLYLQCYEHCADMDGEVKDSNDHTDDQVRLQTLILHVQKQRLGSEIKKKKSI